MHTHTHTNDTTTVIVVGDKAPRTPADPAVTTPPIYQPFPG